MATRKRRGGLRPRLHYTVIAEVDASEFFVDGGESAEELFCRDRCAFEHREAGEFVLHIGDQDQLDYRDRMVADMKEAGCDKRFIALYKEAAEGGAVRVIFYA